MVERQKLKSVGRNGLRSACRRFALAVFAFSLCFVQASTAIAAPSVQPSERVQRNVVIRSQPTTASSSLGVLRPGETLAVIAEVPGWTQVRLADGRTGYVSKAWTVIVEQPGAGPFLVHAIDVGTGLSIFVEGPGFTLLYDGGSNDDVATGTANRVVAYLRAIRPDLTVIDHLILSHPHRDHVELLPDVFDAYRVRQVWDSGRLNPTCGYYNFLQRISVEAGVVYHDALAGHGVHMATFPSGLCRDPQRLERSVLIPEGDRIASTPISLGPNASMTFLHADGSQKSNVNENSLVVRLDLGARRILLMGDAEAGGRHSPDEQPDPLSTEGLLLACCSAALHADVMFAGHHGSKTSSRSQFVDAVGAKIFIISAGPTKYATVVLPDQEIVDELTTRGTVWRTDANDQTCGANPAKIGSDADGRAGGCDNILIAIDTTGNVVASYDRGSD